MNAQVPLIVLIVVAALVFIVLADDEHFDREAIGELP